MYDLRVIKIDLNNPKACRLITTVIRYLLPSWPSKNSALDCRHSSSSNLPNCHHFFSHLNRPSSRHPLTHSPDNLLLSSSSPCRPLTAAAVATTTTTITRTITTTTTTPIARRLSAICMLPSVTDDTPQARSTIVRSNKLNYFKCTTCA